MVTRDRSRYLLVELTLGLEVNSWMWLSNTIRPVRWSTTITISRPQTRTAWVFLFLFIYSVDRNLAVLLPLAGLQVSVQRKGGEYSLADHHSPKVYRPCDRKAQRCCFPIPLSTLRKSEPNDYGWQARETHHYRVRYT